MFFTHQQWTSFFSSAPTLSKPNERQLGDPTPNQLSASGSLVMEERGESVELKEQTQEEEKYRAKSSSPSAVSRTRGGSVALQKKILRSRESLDDDLLLKVGDGLCKSGHAL